MRWRTELVGSNLFAALFLLFGMTWGSAIALAQSEPLQLTLDQYIVVTSDDGPDEELLLPLADNEGTPGTLIEYQLKAANVSDESLDDIILRLHVPAGTRYVEGSERFDRFVALLQFSIDAGETFRTPPILYFVEDGQGNRVQHEATPDTYTDLRLVVLTSLPPGEEVIFTYRVQVE